MSCSSHKQKVSGNFSKFQDSPFFARQEKRIFLFPLWGNPAQNRPQNPAPPGCPFYTRKSRCEVPERGDFGEENCLGKGGVDRGKKGRKDAQKKKRRSSNRVTVSKNRVEQAIASPWNVTVL